MWVQIRCGQCGGTLVSQDQPSIGYYECRSCGHELTSYDLVLDEGEREATRNGVLGYYDETDE